MTEQLALNFARRLAAVYPRWALRETAEGYLLTLPGGDEAVVRTAAALDAWLTHQEAAKRAPEECDRGAQGMDIPADYLDQIVTGDARHLAKRIPNESVDMVFTDPVYERIEDYEWLAREAARVLKPGGACLAWSSSIRQYEVHPVMARHLTFVLPLTYTKIAKSYRAFMYRTFLWTTPCLWFHKGKRHEHQWLIDSVVDVDGNAIVSTATPPTDSYKWHKNPEAYRRWLRALCPEGGVVWDPFTGSGSLPVECRLMGRHFIASELRPDVAATARERVAAARLPILECLEQPALFDTEAA